MLTAPPARLSTAALLFRPFVPRWRRTCARITARRRIREVAQPADEVALLADYPPRSSSTLWGVGLELGHARLRRFADLTRLLLGSRHGPRALRGGRLHE